jgi:hypothetical protein
MIMGLRVTSYPTTSADHIRRVAAVPHKETAMNIFDPEEKVEFLARQTLHYDRYAGRQYFLERVEVHDKCGLICVERSDEYGTHTKVLLPPVYDEIHVLKISSDRAIYNKYVIYANGIKVALFTMVLNAWVPILCLDKSHVRRQISHN